MIKINFSNKILFSFSILLLFSFFPSSLENAGLFNDNVRNGKTEIDDAIKYPSVFPLSTEDKEWIENNLISMTTREKCAQMIMSWAKGKDYANDSTGLARVLHLVWDLKIGGLIFSDGNV